MHEVQQLLCRLHHLYRTEVDTTEYDMVFFRRFDVCLQRGLSVEFDGEVDDVATFHQTVGRGIRPPACNVNTYR